MPIKSFDLFELIEVGLNVFCTVGEYEEIGKNVKTTSPNSCVSI